MNCEFYKTLIIDAIYNEISNGDRKIFEQHLKECSECKEEYERLKMASETLKEWKDVEPAIRTIFIEERRPATVNTMKNVGRKRVLYAIGIALASIVILLSVANTSIEVKDGNFSMKLGIFGSGKRDADKFINYAELEEIRKQDMELFSLMLNEYDRERRIETKLLINRLNEDIEKRHQDDIMMICDLLRLTLSKYIEDTERRIDKTDRALSTLIQYIDSQSKFYNYDRNSNN